MEVTAKHILDLIEKVDPQNPQDMKEIDAQVMLFVYPGDDTVKHIVKDNYRLRMLPKYSKSRDALKAIRPICWFFENEVTWKTRLIPIGTNVTAFKHIDEDGTRDFVCAEHLPTEELAELHAIIQAIAYERSQ